MANHGKIGEQLESYRSKRRSIRTVSGLYVSATSETNVKPISMTYNAYKRTQRRKGKDKLHYRPYRTEIA